MVFWGFVRCKGFLKIHFVFWRFVLFLEVCFIFGIYF